MFRHHIAVVVVVHRRSGREEAEQRRRRRRRASVEVSASGWGRRAFSRPWEKGRSESAQRKTENSFRRREDVIYAGCGLTCSVFEVTRLFFFFF